jgi:hypothetical protein
VDAVLDEHESVHIFLLPRPYLSGREGGTNMGTEPTVKLTSLQIQNGKTVEVEAVDTPRHEATNGDWEWVQICSLLREGRTERNNDLDADVN